MNQKFRIFRPGVTAAQLRLQPRVEPPLSVKKKISTLFVLDVMDGGRKYPELDGSVEENPHLLSIKVVPSPSVILTKSYNWQVEVHSTAN